MHDQSARGVARQKHEVVIAGGGPTGLMLAAELALARVDVAIVERRANRDLTGTRAGGLHARTLEVLDQRGIVDRFLAQGQKAQVAGFASVRLDIGDFLPVITMGSACDRNTSSASWRAGSTSCASRSSAAAR
jgi:3-(3-hydroxy-phenyl)propionate hydroxylase